MGTTPRDQALDDLTALAAQVCSAPIAWLSLTDDRGEQFTSVTGLLPAETPWDFAFGAPGLPDGALLVVEDATADRRFADSPLVTGAPGIRFYASARLCAPDRLAEGTLCVMAHGPRPLTASQAAGLRTIGRQVLTWLDLRRLRADVLDDRKGCSACSGAARSPWPSLA
jgi:GAF domain-containing protein